MGIVCRVYIAADEKYRGPGLLTERMPTLKTPMLKTPTEKKPTLKRPNETKPVEKRPREREEAALNTPVEATPALKKE